jgi:hypothetical protein
MPQVGFEHTTSTFEKGKTVQALDRETVENLLRNIIYVYIYNSLIDLNSSAYVTPIGLIINER